MRRGVAAGLGVVALAAAILVLRAGTMATHTAAPPGSRTDVVVDVSTRNADPSATTEALARAVALTCTLEVDAVAVGDVVPLGPDRFGFGVTPALDRSDRLQLEGCLEDLRVDHVLLDVVSLDDVAAGER